MRNTCCTNAPLLTAVGLHPGDMRYLHTVAYNIVLPAICSACFAVPDCIDLQIQTLHVHILMHM